MNKIWYFLFIIIAGCSSPHSKLEKYHDERNKITDVRNEIKEIEITDVLIGGVSRVYILDTYLLIADYMSQGSQIHLFDKNTFEYITSTGYRGQGPGEITSLGHIGVNNSNRVFYVSDHGKQTIFSFSLDSLLINPDYMPEVKLKMNESMFPDKYQYINDTLCIGLVIEPIGNADYKPSVAKWNMNTGEIKVMKYEHPEIKKKRIAFASSVKHGLYVECHLYHDLMTICDLDGNLKCNIYGKQWSSQRDNTYDYYGQVAFCGDKIVALYAGKDMLVSDERGDKKLNHPTKFHIFNLEGDYIQSLETGYRITSFCYDEENHRVIMTMDDDIQFGYLDLSVISSF